jgi:hypothetical protein
MLVRKLSLGVSALSLMTGLTLATGPARAQVQVVVPSQPVQANSVIIAPNAPPPPRVETIPAPPVVQSQTMTWVPGHWSWSGANWAWAEGHYLQRPAPQAVWQPGQWMQQPTGGYVWVDGHWQS